MKTNLRERLTRYRY